MLPPRLYSTNSDRIACVTLRNPIRMTESNLHAVRLIPPSKDGSKNVDGSNCYESTLFALICLRIGLVECPSFFQSRKICASLRRAPSNFSVAQDLSLAQTCAIEFFNCVKLSFAQTCITVYLSTNLQLSLDKALHENKKSSLFLSKLVEVLSTTSLQPRVPRDNLPLVTLKPSP